LQREADLIPEASQTGRTKLLRLDPVTTDEKLGDRRREGVAKSEVRGRGEKKKMGSRIRRAPHQTGNRSGRESLLGGEGHRRGG